MNQLFKLGSEEHRADTLLLEIGPDIFGYAMLDSAARSFSMISYNGLEEQDAEAVTRSLLNGLNREFETVKCCSAFPAALLVPVKLYKEDQNLPALVYEIPAGEMMKDTIQEWQLHTVYSIPPEIVSIISEKYPHATYSHAYTPSLKIYNGFVAPDQVDIHFSTRHFRVIVKKDGILQLAQTYAYKWPLDVVYFLLKIFSEFGLNQSEAFLVISGLVEQDSALYRELHHYFANIHFSQAPAYTIPAETYPSYYFTSLYNLAACVS